MKMKNEDVNITEDDRKSMSLGNVIANFTNAGKLVTHQVPQKTGNISDSLKTFGLSFDNIPIDFNSPYSIPSSRNAAANFAAWCDVMNEFKGKLGLNSDEAYCVFMGQILHECGNFKYMEECGNEQYFRRYEGRRDLGNVNWGDGVNFHGRGPIQVTGRSNYTKIYKEFFVPNGLSQYNIVEHPELGNDPKIASYMTIGWCLCTNNGKRFINACNKASSGMNMESIINEATRAVNGGTNGLTSRQAITYQLLRQLRSTGNVDIKIV